MWQPLNPACSFFLREIICCIYSQSGVYLKKLPRETSLIMLSARGSAWGKADFAHGKQDIYDPISNPKGVVSFANAENVCHHKDFYRGAYV